MKAAIGSLVACLLVLGLAACGEGSSSDQASGSTTSTTPPPPQTSVETAPDREPGHSDGKPPVAPSSSGSKSGLAGFIRSGADNSIPDFGSESSGSERAAAVSVLSRYLASRADDRWSESCAYLGAAMRHQVATFVQASEGRTKNCAGLLKLAASQSSESSGPRLSRGLVAFRVEGDRAFALFYGPHGQPYMMPMAREGGSWKVNQLNPVAYPPGSASSE